MDLVHILIGAFFMLLFILLIKYTHRKDIRISWWQWILTFFCIIYIVFIVELILGFISEGSTRAALVMGTLFSIFAVVWAVLLGRFVFARTQNN